MTKLIKKSVSIILTLLLMISVFTIAPLSVGAATPESCFTFDSSTGTITRYTGTDTVVDIPSTIGGTAVTSIGSSAFSWSNSNNLTSVTIPEGVTSIGSSAFSSRTLLSSVSLPNSLLSIGANAFNGCSSLTSVTIPNNVTTIANNAFAYCSSLSNVTIGSGVTSIGNSAFSNCTSLTSIVIPNSVLTLEGYAFYNCTALTNLTIGRGLQTVNYNSFYNCNNITNLTIDGNNQFNYDYLPYTITDVTITGTAIKDNAFTNRDSLVNVTINEGVESIGDYAFYGCGISSITIPDSVTSIGEVAFSGCGISSITIPDSVESLGDYAFYDCSNLTSITIGSGVTSLGEGAFLYCDNVTDLTVTGNGSFSYYNLPYSTVNDLTVTGTAVDSGVFSSFTALNKVTIAETVESVGADAFSGGSNILFAVFENDETVIDTNAFGDYKPIIVGYNPSSAKTFANNNDFLFIDITDFSSLEASDFSIASNGNGLKITGYKGSDTVLTIPSTIYGLPVNGIGDYAFPFKSITSVTIPSGITSIGNNPFYGCSNLASITVNSGNANYSSQDGVLYDKNKTYLIQYPAGKTATSFTVPNTVTTLGSGAFYYCSNLESIVIGDGVTSIPSSCFSGLSNLESVTIGSSVESINGGAFSGCSSLTSIVIPDSVTYLSSGVFGGCTSLKSITIGNGLTTITWGCFSDLSSVKTVTLGSSVEEILGGAFYNCSSLENIELPDGLTTIGGSAFYGCSSLTSVAIPDSVTSLGNSAFRNCSSIESVTIGSGVTYLDEYVFGYCTSLRSVSIPSSVNDIHVYAFAGCPYFSLYGHGSSSGLPMDPSLYSSYFNLDEYEYTVNENGTITITKYNGSASELDVPSVLPSSDGFHTVTAIGANAFKNKTGLTKATIPVGVESFGSGAFDGCANLTLYGSSYTAAYAENNGIPYVLLVKTNTGSGYTYAPLTNTQTKDGGDSSFGLTQSIYGNIELIGVQQKADSTNTMRFVSVINEGLIKDAKEGGDIVDYGFVMAKTDYTSTASATNSFISKVTLDAPNTLKNSCMYTDNNFSGAYGKNSTDTKYKYVTLAVKNVPVNQGFVVRFYIKMKSGDVYYANYNTSFTGCVTNYAGVSSALS